MKKISILLTLFLVALVTNGQTLYFAGTLSGAQAGTPSPAGGVVIVRYNMATRYLEHFGNFRGLLGNISNQHIHTGAPGVSGPVTVPLTSTGGPKDGGLSGSQTLTAAQEADLLAGNMYTNVHSSPNFGGGEIRAQLLPTTAGQTVLLNARLQGAQSTPPNASPATGMANALIDKSTHTLWLTSTYTGLTTPANNAHIHLGAPTVSGPVIIPVKFSATTTGSLDTSRVISVQNETDILNGNTYVNIHTEPPYTAGEIRGQLLPAAQLRYFANSLSGANESTPNASPARGTVIVRYNTETNFFEFWGDYQNLSATISGSHIHGPAAIGADAGVLFNLTNTGGTMGTLTVTRTLTEDEESQLMNGLWYANVHSTGTFSAGEIRAQLLPLSSGETQYLTASLDVDEERAAFPGSTITSSATGTSTAVLDKITRNIYLTGSYSGLSSGITNSHIHRGAAGVSGPVSIQLQFINGTTSGTITGSAANIRASLMDSIINGSSYVNIHSVTYGSGEIRGQLGDLVLPVKLVSFNAFKDRDKVSVAWTSAQEENIVSYDIEQQDMETRSWIKKGTIIARGGTSPSNYSFKDMPLIGKSAYVIYRLRINDANGSHTYSSLVKINYIKGQGELMILSNPVHNGMLRYSITGLPGAQNAEATVIDYNGRVVAKTTTSSLTNNEINITNLATGMYKLVIRVSNEVLQQSFVK